MGTKQLDDAVPQVQAQEQGRHWSQGTHGYPNMQSHVFVPFAWALLWAVLVGGAATAGAWLLLRSLVAAQVGLFFFFITAVVMFWKDSKWTRSTIWTVEQITGMDLDRDGHQGEPGVGAHAAGVGQGPGERDPVEHMLRLTQPFIRTCFEQGREGRAATQPKLREAGFTDEEIEALRDGLVRQGIAAWVNAGNHKSGLRLLVDYQKAQRLGEKIVWLPNGKAWQE